jgi:hypothetical protein
MMAIPKYIHEKQSMNANLVLCQDIKDIYPYGPWCRHDKNVLCQEHDCGNCNLNS